MPFSAPQLYLRDALGNVYNAANAIPVPVQAAIDQINSMSTGISNLEDGTGVNKCHEVLVALAALKAKLIAWQSEEASYAVELKSIADMYSALYDGSNL